MDTAPEQPEQVAVPELLQTSQPGHSARHRAQKAWGEWAHQETQDFVVRSGGRGTSPHPQGSRETGMSGLGGTRRPAQTLDFSQAPGVGSGEGCGSQEGRGPTWPGL